ncbi:MAG TPA: GNAT family N-acetyltransferase [Terriglobales bacterium]|nr:GNAT family N-acetyltransferase [Terriglobales bacterium]
MNPAIPDGFTDLAPGKLASVVTFLELRQLPALANSSPNPVRLRSVEHPDLDWYRALYRRAGAQWLWFSRLEMTDAQLSSVLNNPANELFLAEHDRSEVGMAELDRSHPPDVEITFFGLFPEAIGKRLGRPFMCALLHQAWQKSAARVWLHTCNLDAPAALSFYMKCGFVPYKQAIEVADDPRIRGILPADTAPHVPIIR